MANLITGKQYNEIKNKHYTLISYDLDSMKRAGTYTADLVELTNYMLLRQDLGHLLLNENQLSVMETCEPDMNHILAIVSARKQGDAQ
jgi:hypothetical protein